MEIKLGNIFLEEVSSPVPNEGVLFLAIFMLEDKKALRVLDLSCFENMTGLRFFEPKNEATYLIKVEIAITTRI